MNKIGNAFSIEQNMFNKHYHGYIVKLADHEDFGKIELTKAQAMKINKLVEYALQNGSTLEFICGHLEKLGDDGKEGKRMIEKFLLTNN